MNWREPLVTCIGGVGGSVINYEDYEALQRHAKWLCTSSAVAMQANRYVTVCGWHLGKCEKVSGSGEAHD